MSDWDNAYANAAYIPDSGRWPDAWNRAAAAFRATAAGEFDLSYGPGAPHRFDMFRPEGEPRGLMVFVHGGYWLDFDKSSWSHLAAGAVARGWAAALPSYTLAPEARIAQIGTEVRAAIQAAAARIPGPIAVAGHSAGGQLAARAAFKLDGIVSLLSISGLHDLRPLMRSSMNATLRLDEAECFAESPALSPAPAKVRATAWVGADERPEFRRQARLLADAWGAALVEEPGRHHFDVIDGLADPAHPMLDALLG